MPSTMPLFFSRQIRTALAKLDPKVRASFSTIFPANVVLHVCANGAHGSLTRKLTQYSRVGKKRRDFWASQRVRQEGNGVVLAFPLSSNLIHAGQQLPSLSWASSIRYVKLKSNGHLPLAHALPNMVATGQFSFPIMKSTAMKMSCLSHSHKFPGFALTHPLLPDKVTPEVYTTVDGSKNAKFIVPGITSADHLAQTLTLLSDLFAPVCANDPQQAAKTAPACASGASGAAA